MFEQGESYRFTMWEPGANGGTITERAPCRVLEVDCSLVKVRSGGGDEVIINTGGIAFVSATKA
jgi:hypothetical protein